MKNGPIKECRSLINPSNDGMLQLYRMGSPLGVAAGFGIYIDGQPMGHIGNRESLRIPLPAGTHTLHMTCGVSRRCNDLTFTISPASPFAFVKVHMKPGFWVNSLVLEVASAADMPKD